MNIKVICIFLYSLAFLRLSAQPTISFTFDDGITNDYPGYKFEEWNGLILAHLKDLEIHAIFFVTGANKLSVKGKLLLESWNEMGHSIANHTFSHPNFNSKDVSLEKFSKEILKTDSVIQHYNTYLPLFRFPYLKEGNTRYKVDGIRSFLEKNGYKNGYVTIDASDWYINARLLDRLKEDPHADIEDFKDYYLEHIWDRAMYYESLSFELEGRHISHTLLLHHNLTSALFLEDLGKMFQERGWKLISAKEAYEDPIYNKIPRHAGESLIWALAKDSGKYEEVLRYPAEDSRYEKGKMDKLGL